MPQSLPISSKDSQEPTFPSRGCYIFSPSLNWRISWKNCLLSVSTFSSSLQPIPICLCSVIPPKWFYLNYLYVAKSSEPLSIVFIVLDLSAASITADHWPSVLLYSYPGSVIPHSLDFLITFPVAPLEPSLLDIHLCPDPSMLQSSPSLIISPSNSYLPIFAIFVSQLNLPLLSFSFAYPKSTTATLKGNMFQSESILLFPQPAPSPVYFRWEYSSSSSGLFCFFFFLVYVSLFMDLFID